jgi:hypothetical protein
MRFPRKIRSWFAARDRRAREKHARKQALDVVRALPVEEREVIELRYGLRDGTPRTLEEVEQAFGVTRERIRQIERDTLAKLAALDPDFFDDPDEPEPEGGVGVREPRRPTPPGTSGAAALPLPDS